MIDVNAVILITLGERKCHETVDVVRLGGDAVRSTAQAEDDYLVTVEEFGYEDALISKDGEEPEDEVFFTIETAVRPGVPFRSRLRVGAKTYLMQGKLRFDENGNAQLEMEYSLTIDTGRTIPVGDGKTEPVLDVHAGRGHWPVLLNTPVTCGGFETRGDDGGKIRATKKYWRAEVVPYRPDAEEDSK